ncbi:SDR family NAD(P)-dependent oxidoreductase [Sandarakinorhabdus sp.]|uniref:SDR family NAD(P)-dependent oxidoreductase n=1 Tax=Sandarakinorhabdus sp. TaxID=1916663 RepID=UPI00286E8290|nr:SDR family NAD(P)-dependent oxidoreductase [Sandarakinorhabdus sp.]
MARIVVTGARRGIGREIALTLARAGHAVVATMRSTDGCDLADIAAAENLAIEVAALDVDDDASVAALFAQPGMGTVDVLINNAGILSINAVEDESMAMLQAIMNTNFFGVVRCMKAVVPAMRTRGHGLIINISSISGRMAVFGQGAYCASKHALEAASEALAQELAPFGVRVAMVEPGIIATDMAVENLPSPRADSAYPHGRRMLAFYADTGNSGPSPSVVAETVLDIVSGRITAFRTPTGPGAAAFLALRGSMTDEAWITMSDTLDDGVFFERFGAAMAAG